MNDADAGREAAMAALVEYVVAEWRRERAEAERAEAEGKRAA